MIVQRFGGTINFESRVNKGSNFFFTFTLDSERAKSAEFVCPTQARETTSKLPMIEASSSEESNESEMEDNR